jgi:hypothetical protein
MKLKTLQAKIEKHLEAIRTLVQDNMQSKGDKETECQRLCVLNRVSDVEHASNGIVESDLIV